MIPLSDDNPTVRLPIMTVLLLAGMLSAWLVVQGGGFDARVLAMSVCNLGLVPGELTGQAPLGFGVPIARGLECVVDHERINWLTPVISLFLHGGWAHLLGNGLFLWVFGNNIEDVMGRGRFLVFYLACGLAAAAAHIAVDPASPLPTVGASGAISGVMGAYLILYPRVRVRMLVFVFVMTWPAWAVLLYWLAFQLLAGLPQIADPGSLTGGVAVWAHIGGFIAGAVLIRTFIEPELVERRRAILLQRGLLRMAE